MYVGLSRQFIYHGFKAISLQIDKIFNEICWNMYLKNSQISFCLNNFH